MAAINNASAIYRVKASDLVAELKSSRTFIEASNQTKPKIFEVFSTKIAVIRKPSELNKKIAIITKIGKKFDLIRGSKIDFAKKKIAIYPTVGATNRLMVRGSRFDIRLMEPDQARDNQWYIH